MSPPLGELVALAVIAAAILISAAVRGLCRAVRLERLLDEHELAAAMDLDLPRGGGECGCFWHYLPGGHFRLYTCEAHAFICSPDGEA